MTDNAQTVRAILLASATVTSMRGFRASMPSSHEPAGAPRVLAWITTALLPMMSSRLGVRSLILEIAPSFCLPPVEACFGTNPNHRCRRGGASTPSLAVTLRWLVAP